MKVLAVKLDNSVARSLEDLSLRAGKSPENVLSDVIARYVHYSGWHQDLLELSLEGLEHGDFASREEIDSVFTRWGGGPAPMPAGVVWSALGLRALRKELEHMDKTRPEAAASLAAAVWSESTAADLPTRAFPGMVSGSLEARLDNGEYCLAFRELNASRQLIGVVPSA